MFPALFTAGMTLIDTTDGVLMLGAYGWAFMKPIRKLYYNMTITAVSVVVAVAYRRTGNAQPHRRSTGLTAGFGARGPQSILRNSVSHTPAAPAVTLIEVSKLYGLEFLIEIEAVAAA